MPTRLRASDRTALARLRRVATQNGHSMPAQWTHEGSVSRMDCRECSRRVQRENDTKHEAGEALTMKCNGEPAA